MPDREFKDVLAGVRPGGCVDRFIPDFVAGLVEDGYSLSSARDYGRSAAHFGRWLDSCRLRGPVFGAAPDYRNACNDF